ncbi:MAG: CBS domain-containing protein [Polyangiales bacterium]
MSEPLHTVGPDTRLPAVERLLRDAGVSGVPVVDAQMRPLGVISRTDLVQAGAVPAVTGTQQSYPMLPDRRIGDVKHGPALCVPIQGSLADAVSLMREERVHRVLVTDADRLCGIVSVWDVMRVVADARISRPIGTMMSSPVVSVLADEDTEVALHKLRAARVHGLLVVERGWPIGVFSQEEALGAALWPAPTLVEQWFSSAVLTLPPSMAVHRAAAQACATHSRDIAVMDLEGVGGIVTASDFLSVEAD